MGYNGKYGLNSQGIREISDDLFELIKSDNESMIEIGERVVYERELQDNSTESKIIEFDFDFAEKLKIEERGIFQK